MRRRLGLALILASGALWAVAACVGDDPQPIVTTPTPDAAPTSPTATTTPTTSATTPPVDDSGPAPVADAGTMCEQRVKPDGSDLSFCEDFDDPTRDGGYTFNVLDGGGRFFKENGNDFSDPSALNADPGTSSVVAERGGFLRWNLTEPSPIHTINVRMKLKPAVDNNSHLTRQGYTDVILLPIVLPVASAQVALRYTYGRNLIGFPGYIGYSLIVHLPGDGGVDDAGNDPNPNDFTVVPLSTPPPSGTWNEVFLQVQLGGGGSATLTINDLVVAKATVDIPESAFASVEVGAHGTGQMDAPSEHFLDDIRVDVFK